MLVKAIGCPEIRSPWQLTTEVMGNVVARMMGVQTPRPAFVEISDAVARQVNDSLQSAGFKFEIKPGVAAGCELLRALAPFTVGQTLSLELRTQAIDLFIFDMLSQNADRRAEKVNCGLTKDGLVAFDFELCFAHLFVPLIGTQQRLPWEPSNSMDARKHLFYREARSRPPESRYVADLVRRFTEQWRDEVMATVPTEWTREASRIGEDLLSIGDHAEDFARDLTTRCLV